MSETKAETAREFAVTITLKSGVQLHAECDKFVVRRNALGDLREVEWENLSTQWMELDLGEVAAIQCDKIGVD